jgi:aspartate racemase
MKMSTVGIIGGIGPASTIEYYRKIVAAYYKREANGNYPRIIINSINMKKMLDLIGSGKFDEVTEFLVAEINKLADAGADFGLLASNTPHIVFDRVQQASSLALISIVEVTCKKTMQLGLDRVGLFGTKFTMQGGFYNAVLSKQGIDVVIPDAADQDYIHDKYMSELVKGIVHGETRSSLLNIIDGMKHKYDLQGLILGGTELPLILAKDDVPGFHLLDTTEIHVESILENLA